MIQFMKFILTCFLLTLLTGCSDRLDLEKQSISLIYGFDTDKKGKLTVYNLIPNFNEDVEKKYEVHESRVNTSREAKEMFNSSSNGLVSTEKLQLILFSQNLLEKKGAMPYLDVWYRDPKNTGSMRIVAVKGPVSSIIYNDFKDKPPLPEYLTDLTNTNRLYNRTAFTTFHKFHQQSFNKGITPAISEVEKGKRELVVTGSALLTRRVIYKMSLNRTESALLLMLQKEATPPVSLTIRIPSAAVAIPSSLRNTKEKGFVTINVLDINRDISTRYNGNHFVFDIKMKLKVSIAERTFDIDMKKDTVKLTALITKQLEKDFNDLIYKVQRQKLDPFGFGDYARAFQYKHWKEIENEWPHTFSEASVKVTPTLKILENGIIE
ncbi:Ger(x)C family spore germination protein [Bacillus sp. TL12]|uniref:Ger(x)C family spore germination protein n=1 Tax=Bacillus sp. TL12 TaxID=2894756 RepID=UPI001F51A6A2|nr:Ger(x)C family spore germination protein [Bacillus sp. TL12]MCI0763730.1 Ger(x)C family spore germination protein [Bacillus sp. TL12]